MIFSSKPKSPSKIDLIKQITSIENEIVQLKVSGLPKSFINEAQKLLDAKKNELLKLFEEKKND